MKHAPRPLVVVILALNEELNIGKAIDSVGGRFPVLVVDSGSTDRTRQIARARGAEVIEHEFVDYASQRNYALGRCDSQYDWVFFLDADEEFTRPLWDEVEAFLHRDDLHGAYVRYTVWMLGHELKNGAFRGAAVLRLMRPDMARFGRGVNERVEDAALATACLEHPLRHDDHRPLSNWFTKHVRYAQREAALYRERSSAPRPALASLRTKAGRMTAARWTYDRLPLFVRPFLNLGRNVVAGRAHRDGPPGLMFAFMQGLWYPLLVDLLIYESRRQVPGPGSSAIDAPASQEAA